MCHPLYTLKNQGLPSNHFSRVNSLYLISFMAYNMAGYIMIDPNHWTTPYLGFHPRNLGHIIWPLLSPAPPGRWRWTACKNSSWPQNVLFLRRFRREAQLERSCWRNKNFTKWTLNSNVIPEKSNTKLWKKGGSLPLFSKNFPDILIFGAAMKVHEPLKKIPTKRQRVIDSYEGFTFNKSCKMGFTFNQSL